MKGRKSRLTKELESILGDRAEETSHRLLAAELLVRLQENQKQGAYQATIRTKRRGSTNDLRRLLGKQQETRAQSEGNRILPNGLQAV